MDTEFVNTDRLLVQKLREGDESAFEQIFKKYSNKVYYFAIRYQSSKEEAEGVVQDVFIKIWNERASLKEDLSFNSYVFTITKNHLFNINRKKNNARAYRDFVIHRFTQTDNNMENNIIYEDLKKQMDTIIEALPSQRKKVFLLSTLEGFSNKEIAAQLELSVRTVEVHKSLALKTLKKEMNKLLK